MMRLKINKAAARLLVKLIYTYSAYDKNLYFS